MIEKINAIKQALECECYLPALSLALTLPDICGQIEYPDYIFNNGNRNVGKQYKSWFDEWVNKYFADSSGLTDDFKQAKNPYFTGKMCYELRCSFLHSGNSDINDFGEKEDEKNKYSYHFELCINGCDSLGAYWKCSQPDNIKTQKLITVRIDISTLCQNLLLAAEDYYKYKGNKFFIEHTLKIIDIKKKTQFIEDLNKPKC
ncbi:hypothetical protein PMY38_11265 [Clostridium tertium]|uniref:hypothetical protein n=1 Tax=Clostridium TaxID=1485 RepID=UPI001156C9BD|nr:MULTISPECIES: hypothetical protein [Clostridium]MDB1956853.1 hypothetical protein [Clostridium tertium]MDB1959180.1 hypothetical protein [Clostridium tertium]MDB1963214.1 hypothetical protein [Clostridium tertium]MDB1967836.1 hypothetical protein [Clostridium tertium]MDU7086182.1 hypothetical protein [Clostridium sp.]